MSADYCPPCAPAPCAGECLGDLPGDELQCDHCDQWLSADVMAQCWVCWSAACDDCIDAHGFPCAHYSERMD